MHPTDLRGARRANVQLQLVDAAAPLEPRPAVQQLCQDASHRPVRMTASLRPLRHKLLQVSVLTDRGRLA